MLTLKVITEETDRVIRGLEKKHFKGAQESIAKVIELNDKRRGAQNQLDKNLAEVNQTSKNIGMLMKEGKKEEAETAKQRVAEIKEANKAIQAEMDQAAEDMQNLLYTIPNVPYDEVPEGVGADDNKVEKMGGMETELPKDALPHWELAKKYDLIDFDLGVKITGAGFPVYKGQGAQLQRALINFFLDEARKSGYTEIMPPTVVNAASGYGTGQLPDKEELDAFKELLNDNMPLDHRTITHIIELEGSNIMNILARCVLEMYTFDPNPDDISRDNLMRQSIELIAKFPTIIAYAYNIYRHSVQGRSLHIRHPRENLSIAENFLYMMKHENYSELDARMLDLLLIIQAEHGGGNNSTFTVRVTSSTRTDTYSSIAAGIGSLKGPLHGGANIKVINMFHHLKEAIKDWGNVTELDTYLKRMLNKEAYDKTGLIYGIGHAVYTLSDPRAVELKRLAGELAKEKGREDEYNFLKLIEQEGIKCLQEHRGGSKPACANLDFYSGFIYEMIGLPQEIYTPIFAMARIVGWTAHRIEELNFEGRRIIRPAYKNILGEQEYKPLNER